MNRKQFIVANIIYGIFCFFIFLFAAIKLSIMVSCQDDQQIRDYPSILTPSCSYVDAQLALLLFSSLLGMATFIIGFCTALPYLICAIAYFGAFIANFAYMVQYKGSLNYSLIGDFQHNQQTIRDYVYAQLLLVFGSLITVIFQSIALFVSRRASLGGCGWKRDGCKLDLSNQGGQQSYSGNQSVNHMDIKV